MARRAAVRRFSDGFTNPLLRVGQWTRNTAQAGRYVPRIDTLNRQELEWAYQGSWMCGLAVDVLAEDMTREGVDITCDDVKAIDLINRDMDDLRVWDSICEALKWSRLYGGSIAVMLIDGQDASTPLVSCPRGAFRGLAVFDRWQLEQTAQSYVQQLGPDFGKPEYYTVLQGQSEVEFKQKIHYSRVIRFEGRRLPFNLRQSYQGWGASVIEPIFDLVKAYDFATNGASQLLSKAYLRYYKVEGLRDILTNSVAREGFLKQMDIMREFQGIEGLTIGDTSDDFQTLSYTFTGIPEIMLQIGQQVSGAIGVPLVRLFGQSPVGFNSTGESDLRIYYDNVRHDQDTDLRPGLKRLLSVMHENATGQKPCEDFGFEFRSLWQMTNEQRAQAAQALSGSIIAALQADAISTATALKELRKISDVVGIFSTITDEDIAAAEDVDNALMPPDAEDVTNGNEKQGVPGAEENPENPGVVRDAPRQDREADRADRPPVQGRD